MSAERLREAAALMRSRANACLDYMPEPPWHSVGALLGGGKARVDAEHMATWTPAVALAVADWLDRTADDSDQWHGIRAACRDLDRTGGETAEGISCACSYKDCYECGKWHDCIHGEPNNTPALAVANAYLGDRDE